jgi:hypothetical protein
MEPKQQQLPIQPPPRNELELIDQVGLWANYNFGKVRGPDYGIVEEIGEAIHAVLKRRQKIRGFDNDDVFYEYFNDSLADAIIYLADFCYIYRSFFKFKRNMQISRVTIEDERKIIAHLLQAVSQLFMYEEIMVGERVEVGAQEIYNLIAQRICDGLEHWATAYDIDLPSVVTVVWEDVKQRDWTVTKNYGKVATLQRNGDDDVES